MRQTRSQSAMEFMLTYGYVFLIIAIAVGILVLFLNVPKTTVPFQCNFYSGLSCVDVALVPSNAGASLIIDAIDSQPGVINASSFNAMINYKSSTVGFCLPSRVLDGQYVYCEANFSFTPTLSNIYYGTFSLTANYCATQAQNLSTLPCPSSNTVVYGGSVRVQPSVNTPLTNTLNALITNSPVTFYYAPVTITNNQPIATPAPFQVGFTFNAMAYSRYLKFVPREGGLGAPETINNIEFSTLPAGRGAQLEAWIESSYNIPSANVFIWVNLPQGMPANSSETIYVNFMPFNTVSANGPTGLAPGEFWFEDMPSYLPFTPYAPFDNGALVFDFYDNFAGTTLSSKWTSSGGVVVNNGLTLQAGSTTSYIKSVNMYSPINHMLDVGFEVFSATVANSFELGFNAYNAPAYNALYWISGTLATGSWEAFSANAAAGGPYGFTPGFIGGGGEPDTYMMIGGGTNSVGITNYAEYSDCYEYMTCYGGPSEYSTTSYTLGQAAPIYLQNNIGGVSSGNSAAIFWVRIRGTPPNGVMPTVTFGNVVTLAT